MLVADFAQFEVLIVAWRKSSAEAAGYETIQSYWAH